MLVGRRMAALEEKLATCDISDTCCNMSDTLCWSTMFEKRNIDKKFYVGKDHVISADSSVIQTAYDA